MDKNLEIRLKKLLDAPEQTPIPLSKVIDSLANKGRPLLILFLIIPFCQPLVIPGLSIPFGLVVALIGMRISSPKPLWLPKFLLNKKFNVKTLQKITNIFFKFLSMTEKWIHRRLQWACEHRFAMTCNRSVIFLMGILLCIPLPLPLINIPAAWPILFISLGILKDDGLMVLIGHGLALCALIFFIFLISSVKELAFHIF